MIRRRLTVDLVGGVACVVVCGTLGVAQGADVSELIRRLNSPNNLVRVAAAAEVGKLGPQAASAAPALIDALKCERLEVLFDTGQIANSRARFADALIQLGDLVVPLLEDKLGHDNGLVRVWAARVLYGIDGKRHVRRVIPVLVAALREGNEVASDAALILERMGKDARSVMAALIARLDHQDLVTRCNLAHALAAVASAEDRRPLIQALRHDSEFVRIGAAFALQRIAPESAGLAQSAIADGLRSTSPEVRRQAVWAVGQLGGSAQPLVEQLIQVLPDLTPDPRAYFFGGGVFGRHATDPSIVLVATGRTFLPLLVAALDSDSQRARVMAAVALLRLDRTQAPRVAPILKAARRDSDRGIRFLADMNRPPSQASAMPDMNELIRAALQSPAFGPPSPAAAQLVRRGSAAVDPLMKVLHSGDGEAAGRVSRILAQIGQPALPALSKAVRSNNDQLRVFAVRTLSGMGERAVPLLAQALKDDLYPVRRAARYALKSMGTPDARAALQQSQGDK